MFCRPRFAARCLAGTLSTLSIVGPAIGLTVAPPVLAAPRIEPATQVVRLNREALELFEALEVDQARKVLLEALEVAKKGGLGEHAVVARTYGNLGMVVGLGKKDRAQGFEHLRRALAIKPDLKLPAEWSSPEAAAFFDEAKAESGKAKEAASPKADAIDSLLAKAEAPVTKTEPASSASGQALRCPGSGEVEVGDEVTLRCVAAPDLKVASVLLFYKRSGALEFTTVPMAEVGGTNNLKKASWAASIPGADVKGSQLSFYFEARDPQGTPVAMAGGDAEPRLLTVRGGQVDETVSARARSEEAQSETDEQAQDEGAGKFFLGIGIGAGGGYASGDGLEAFAKYARGFSAGFAPQGMGHLLPELGYFLSPRFALSLQGRHQYIPADNGYMAGGANSVLLRATFFSGGGVGRFFGSVALGGGEGVRMVVTADASNGGTIKDTVRGGPLLMGGSGGFSYALGKSASWVIELGALAGAPAFSVALDLNTGLRFRL